MKRLTDRDFVYTPSFATDLRVKFKKLLAEQKKRAEQTAAVVKQIKKAAK